jgi:uncharacterized protein (TIGR04255 family)
MFVFPDSPRVVFKKNPLTEVICQLRFPPILQIASEEPSGFQELIRSQYPFYERTQAIPQEISTLFAQLSIAPALPAEWIAHRFLTADKACHISLTRDFIAVSALKYTRWENFRREIVTARKALEKIYSPAFYTRVGLRYRDVIDRRNLALENTAWKELFRPSLAGLLGEAEIAEHLASTQNQTQIKLAQEGQFMLLQHGSTPLSGGEQGYAIDADFFSPAQLSGDGALDVLDRFNRIAGNFFRWAITERLSAALEPTQLD